MKIAFITAKYYPEGAGAGRSVRSLAEAVVTKGHEAIVIRLTPEKQQRTEYLNGVKIYYLPIRNIYWPDTTQRGTLKKLVWHIIDAFNPLAMRDVGRVLDIEKPDVVNTNVISGFSTGIFYTVKKRGILLVHTMRDYYLLCARSSMFKNGRHMEGICPECKPFIPLRRLAAKSVDMFLANSEYVLNRHKQFALITDNQFANVQWNMNEGDKISEPKSITKKETMRFGFIGSLDEVKGLEVLLEATSILKTKHWVLKIAGEGDEHYVSNLRKKYPDSRIEYLGFISPNEFYDEQVDIIICPSVYGEPLARVIYESYQAAVPVIASSMGGTPEIIDEGETGFTYEATDSKALAQLMDKIAGDEKLYETSSKGAAQKARLFTSSQITESYLAKIQDAIERKAS